MTDEHNEQGNGIQRSIGRLEGKMDDVISSVLALKTSFDNLEKGRLSTLEINFAKLQTEVSEKARMSALWTSGVVSIIVGLIVYYLTNK